MRKKGINDWHSIGTENTPQNINMELAYSFNILNLTIQYKPPIAPSSQF